MVLIPCMGNLFELKTLSPPSCTYIHCICCVNCMGSIPCIGNFFALRPLSPPPCTYIHYIHCMGSIPCLGNLFALMNGSSVYRNTKKPYEHKRCQANVQFPLLQPKKCQKKFFSCVSQLRDFP